MAFVFEYLSTQKKLKLQKERVYLESLLAQEYAECSEKKLFTGSPSIQDCYKYGDDDHSVKVKEGANWLEGIKYNTPWPPKKPACWILLSF